MSDGKKNGEVRTFYVTEKSKITAVCSDCGCVKTAILSPSDIPKIKDQPNGNCKCNCGAVFPCRIEFRRAYRKKGAPGLNLPKPEEQIADRELEPHGK